MQRPGLCSISKEKKLADHGLPVVYSHAVYNHGAIAVSVMSSCNSPWRKSFSSAFNDAQGSRHHPSGEFAFQKELTRHLDSALGLHGLPKKMRTHSTSISKIVTGSGITTSWPSPTMMVRRPPTMLQMSSYSLTISRGPSEPRLPAAQCHELDLNFLYIRSLCNFDAAFSEQNVLRSL
jgi:hypothetical protein